MAVVPRDLLTSTVRPLEGLKLEAELTQSPLRVTDEDECEKYLLARKSHLSELEAAAM
jgi:hypothetical protein